MLERSRTVQYMTEKAHSNLINVYEKAEINDGLRLSYSVSGQEARGTNCNKRNFILTSDKKFIIQTLKQATQRCYGASILGNTRN